MLIISSSNISKNFKNRGKKLHETILHYNKELKKKIFFIRTNLFLN